jgi:hypothetical protein
MKRFISFGSIEQFRTVVKNVQWMSQYKGNDDEGNPIMDRAAKAPKIKAVGTEKIHGTNAAFVVGGSEIWYQSRKNIITPEKDNAGCAFFFDQRKNDMINYVKKLASKNNINLSTHGVAVYGEFCGGNIQKNSCVSGLNKMFIIFKYAKVFNLNSYDEENNKWVKTI